MKNIIIITGQTATGKTELAVKYAKKYHGELINADSRQIYTSLDIVSGKDLDIIKQIPIHLYDICDPKVHFSSHEWVEMTKDIISSLTKQEITPIIVGGTYFYLAHLLYGIQTQGIKPDWELRKQLAPRTVPELQDILRKYSPQMLEKLNESDTYNPRRLIRKIEIAKQNKTFETQSNFTYSDFFSDFNVNFIGLYYPNRVDLKKALRYRVSDRLKKGAIEEVKTLLKEGYELQDPGLSANACLEIYQYLTGDISYEELVDRWVTIEMQYAKRQYTFMKKDTNIKWTEV